MGVGIKLRLYTLEGWINQLKGNKPKVKVLKVKERKRG